MTAEECVRQLCANMGWTLRDFRHLPAADPHGISIDYGGGMRLEATGSNCWVVMWEFLKIHGYEASL